METKKSQIWIKDKVKPRHILFSKQIPCAAIYKMLKCLCIIRDKKIYENNLQTEAKKHQGIRYFSGDIKISMIILNLLMKCHSSSLKFLKNLKLKSSHANDFHKSIIKVM